MLAGFGKGTIRFPKEFFPKEGFASSMTIPMCGPWSCDLGITLCAVRRWREPQGRIFELRHEARAIDNTGRGDNARLVSSEVAGAFCEKLEQVYGVPVIYSVSARGNQTPNNTALKSEAADDGEVIERAKARRGGGADRQHHHEYGG